MKPALTSRQRLLRAIDRQPVDHPPCCFMSFTILRQRLAEDRYAMAAAEQAMGLDPMFFIPAASRARRPEHPDLRGLPVRFDPRVQVRQWRSLEPDGAVRLHKEYDTPGGRLTTQVQPSGDWPHGDRIPFVDDYQVPRCQKPLVCEPPDLDALRYLLLPPQEADVRQFEAEARQARAYAEEHQLLLAGGWGVGLDMASWLCGLQDLMVLMLEQPGFATELLELIHRWNMQRMAVVLSAPVDLYIRRAWYEGCDFVTPRFFRTVLLPGLRAEADLAHAHGARFGYICSSGTQPMLDAYLQAGIDVLIGVDPVQGTHTDLPLMKAQLGKQVCLWGGVSGAVTVEQGNPAEVRAAVRHAIQVLGPQGLILSPVDNLTVDAPRTWQNVEVFIDEWRKSW
jgi:uroporphyrinogen-III decarboxylase